MTPPPVAPAVVADVLDALPPRLRKRVDAALDKAAAWQVVVDGDGARAELDVTERPALAADLGVLGTPTTIAYDRRGAELLRVTGVPDAEELSGALTGRARPSDG